MTREFFFRSAYICNVEDKYVCIEKKLYSRTYSPIILHCFIKKRFRIQSKGTYYRRTIGAMLLNETSIIVFDAEFIL